MIPEPFTLERPAVDWTRHGGTKQPKILPPPGVEWWTPSGKTRQKGRYYTRTTTLAKTLEDSHALADWRVRRALVGIGQRPDYWTAASALTIDDRDRDELDALAERCIDASGPSMALVGTALHTFTERIDRGEPLGFVPEQYRPLVEAWRRITAPLRFEYREVRTVNDELEVAGTPDAFGFCSLPDPDGVVDERRVIDLKSGSIKYPASMATQLYTYAAPDTFLYDPETGERRPLEVNTRWGLIVHLKSDGSLPPGLHWLNLEHGRQAVELARPVRAWRAVKPDAILVPALVEDAVPADPELDDITDRLVVPSERVVPYPVSGAHWQAIEVSDLGELEAGEVGCPAEPHHGVDCPGDACRFVAEREVDERCELSDLLVTECACRVHRPDVPAGALDDGDELTELELPRTLSDPPVEPVEPPATFAGPDPVVAAIERCITPSDLEALWKTEGHLWTGERGRLAADRMAELKAQRDLTRPRAALLAAIAVAPYYRLVALWTQHHASPLWTPEHDAAATHRHAELRHALEAGVELAAAP